MLKMMILTALTLIGGASAYAKDLKRVTLSDGRYYLIAVPDGVANPPLIIALHGGGGNPAQFESDSGLTKRALANGFAIAYPAGSGRTRLLTWNGIYCCAYAQEKQIDDVAFLDRVVSDAAKNYWIDAKRIFVTGMSNGSIMAETYGALRPRVVRAIGGVAGTMDIHDVRIRGAVPLLHIHGTDDSHVAYNGGYGPDSFVKVDFVAVEKLLDVFRKAAGPGLSYSESVIDPADDGMTTDRLVWSRNGVDYIVHLRVNGGGHNWPGGPRGERKGATRDFDAAEEVIRFFVQFK
jgi:polyhydroxybutyrate depolymerase